MHAMTPRLSGLVAAALVVSGCGGTPEPQPLPKPTASTSPSASAAPSAPVMPEAAKVKTKAGAEAVVRFFLASMERAGDTGETMSFESSYTAECTRCAAITNGIRQTYDAGGTIMGGAWHLKNLKSYGIRNEIAYIDAVVNYEPQTWTKVAGATPSRSPAKRNVLKAFQLTWSDKKWRVAALDPQL